MSSLVLSDHFQVEPLSLGETCQVPAGYHPCNPSILVWNSHYLVNVRCVNYIMANDHDYQPKDEFVHTRNFLVTFDHQWQKLHEVEIKESKEPPYQAGIRGLEDIRLVRVTDRQIIGFTATTCEYNATRIPETVWCEASLTNGIISKVQPLHPRPQETGRKEKNWLPFMFGQRVYALYHHEPHLIIHDLKVDTGTYDVVVSNSHKGISCKGFSGSVSPMRLPDGKHWLYIVHRPTYGPSVTHWLYEHRFIKVDHYFNMVNVSPWFSWKHVGVEFALGLCMDLLQPEVSFWVTFGVRDHEAYRLSLSLAQLESLWSL